MCVRDSALCSEDCLAKLIGELDPNQSGTVGEGDDELGVPLEGLLHVAVGLRLAGRAAVGQLDEGVHRDGFLG